MITIVIDGPEKDRQLAARQLRRDMEVSGKITTLYPDGWPEMMPTMVDVAIVVADLRVGIEGTWRGKPLSTLTADEHEQMLRTASMR